MPVEFTGRDLVTTFHEHPDNQAIRQYKVTYQCATDLVVHYIKVDDAQGTNGDGRLIYKDRLSYTENMAAGLTREPVVTLYAQNADLEWSDGYEVESVNPQPTLPSTPTVQSTINGAFLRIVPPSDTDIAGYRIWKSATSPVALVDDNLIHDGPDTSVAISIPAAGSYYVVVAPYDSFDKTGLNPSDEITVEKADPGEGLGLDELQEQITSAHEEILALTTVYGDTAAAAASAAAAQAAADAAATAEMNAATAQGHAETAKLAAAASATAAATNATNAGNSATAASGSATIASNQAAAAATSATVSASSAAAGTQTVASTLPNNFNQDGQFWSTSYAGTPTRASLADSAPSWASFVTVAGVGRVLEVVATASRDVAALGAERYVSGRKYRVQAMVRTTSGTQTGTLWIVGLDETYTYNSTGGSTSYTADTNWQLVTYTVTTTLAAGTVYLRPLMRVATGGGTVQWQFCNFEDITESEAASGSATAAASSASSAGTSATNAGMSAGAANTSATNAATSAGAANTSSTNASTSATTAAGHASTASTQATVASNSASAAALSAALLLPSRYVNESDPYFSGTPIGDPASMTTLLANETDPAYGPVRKATLNNQSFDWAPKGVVPATSGRTYEFTATYEVVSYSGAVFFQLSSRELNAGYGSINARASSRTISSTGVFTDTMLISNAASSGVLAWDPASVWIRPYCRVQSNAGTCVVRYRSLTIRDVTEREAAEGSASAAAGSASTASTHATNAGNSASAANTSATNAATSAGQASNHASNASTSASSASTSASHAAGSASAASTSATTAANSASNARMTVAATLPSDFSEDGKYWFNTFTGDPTTSGPLTATSIYTYATVASGRILQIAATSATYADFASVGVVPVVAGRTYRVTVTYKRAAGAADATLYCIGLNTSYAYIAGATTAVTAPASASFTTVSVTQTATAAIAGGGAFLRPMFRTPASNTYQVASLLIEDVTSEVAAAGSASAASTSASTAITLATNAGNSATAASNSATAAGTSASNASASASAASSSAAGASNSAAAASNWASIAASVNTGALNKSPTFSDNTAATGNPTNWDGDVSLVGAAASRITGLNGIGYSYRQAAATGQQCFVATSIGTGIIRPNGWYVVEVDVSLQAGTFVGAGSYVSNSNSGGFLQVPFDTTPDDTGTVVGNGAAGRVYKFRKLFQAPNTVSATGVTYLYAMTQWSGFASLTGRANSIDWHKALIRAATPSEIAVGKADGLEASVQQLQGALAQVGGRTTSYWQLQTNAGAGSSTFITAQSEVSRPDYGPITLAGTYSLTGDVIREGLDVCRTGRTGTSNSWTYAVTSVETYTGSAYVSWQSGPITDDQIFMLGLTDATTLSNYPDGDYLIYNHGSLGGAGIPGYQIYESGVQQLNGGANSLTTADLWEVIYTAAAGGTITYRKNGVVVRTVTSVGTGRTFRLAVFLFAVSSRAKNVVFGQKAPSMSSAVSIGASQFHIYNPAGTNWKKALEISNGNALFSGGITAGTYIKMGNGNGWPVALAARDFTVTDGTSITFDTTLASLPAIDFSTIGLAPLATGETYSLYAESLSTTGFTARLKIITPGTPVYHSLTTDTAPGSGPTRQIDKSAYGDATTGSYNVSCNGSITVTNEFDAGGWTSSVNIIVSVWVKRGGVWTSVSSLETNVMGGGGPTSSLTWYAGGPVNLGYQPASAIQAVGVTVSAAEINQGGIASGPTVNDFSALTWTSTSASSTRTATPSSQTTTTTVRPQ